MKKIADLKLEISLLEESISNLPYISTVNDDGETDDNTYQEKLEQNYFVAEQFAKIEKCKAELNILQLIINW